MIHYAETQPFLYQHKEDGLLYLVNCVGHTRQITMGQWASIIQLAVVCQCEQCFVCSIYAATLDIVERKD
jgi:hypothetical protein